MVRKNLLRSVSVIMACMMAVLTVACGSNTATTENGQATAVVETAKEQQLEKSLANSASALGAIGEAGKVETVYVTADANGAVNDVIVSEWLKNAEQSTELSDTTELHDIVNVKGSETFTENGDGTVTWNAAGSDIYYQGTTDKELPVDMKITYTLDGKEISPSELAGKSGKVTIRFEYENKSKQTVNVDGKDIEVYTPFAMVSGMMLDSDKFSNVEISNGKVISEGNNYIVMGVALPGLKESLDISDEKWDELEDSEEIKGKLSNSFEITADTTDFELGMTITMASSDILSDFGAMDMADSSKIDGLKDDMGELNEGSTKLVEGAGTLKDGTGKLAEGSKELKDGTGKLYDGTKELKDGTTKLSDGTGKLADGAGQLSDGAGDLATGAGKLSDGTGKLKDGSKTLAEGVTSYTDGVDKVNSGVKSLGDGETKLKEGSAALAAGTKTLSEGAAQLASGTDTLNKTVESIDLEKAEQTIKMLNEKKATINAKQTELTAKKEAFDLAKAYLTTPGTSCPEDLVPVLNQLSGGKITSAEQADKVKAAGLAAFASQNSGTVTQEPAGVEADEVTAVSGEVTLEDETEPEQTVVEAPKAEETVEKAVEETSEGKTDIPEVVQPAPEVTETTSEPTTINDEDVPLADMIAASAATDNAASDGVVYTEEELELIKKEAIAAYLESDEYKAFLTEYIKNDPTIQAQLGATVKAQVASTVGDVSTYAATLASTEASIKAVDETLPLVTELATYLNTFVAEDGLSINGTVLNKQTIIGLKDNITALNNGAAQLKAGLASAATGAATLDGGIGQLQAGTTQLSQGTSTLASNSSALKNGANQVSDGAAQLDSGAAQLKDGADKLATGAKDLKSGADELNTGAGTLDNGATELMNGAKDLNDGAGKLDEGIGKVDDGVQELLDGITKLDQEGIKKLYEAFDGDLTDFVDKLTAIKEAGTEYTSFAGASDEEDCSVKFIIRTAGVKTEDI